MRQLTNSISAGGEVQRQQRNGRTYLTFPTVIAREMVLNYPEFGRDEYLPAENLRQSASDWAGAPITVNHPPDRGEGRTANTPEAFTSDVIGHLFEPEVIGADNDRVRATAWIDEEKVNAIGGEALDIVDRLESGEEVGVSIGYGTIGDEHESGTFNGEEYDVKQGVPVPDHLALVGQSQRPRATPEDGVGAPRLNHVDMTTESDEPTDESTPPSLTEQARAFGAAFKESFGFGPSESGDPVVTNAQTLRTNASEGDAVRWESDGGGSREPDDYRYGVVVNPAPDDSPGDWMVAVYQANEDRDGWEPRDESMPMSDDNLERVGGDGVDSLPAVSQVVTNTINSEDGEAGEADDDGEADPEDTDPDSDPEDEREDEGSPPGDHSDSGSDSDEESDTDTNDSESDSTDDTSTMSDTDERIKALAQNEDVPFDEAVLEEFDDSQLDAVDPDVGASVDEEDDGVEEEDDEEGEDEATTEEPESPETPGDEPTAEVEARVNELAERVNAIDELKDEVESLKEENQELREKADPDVIRAREARKQLAEKTETDEEELAALPDETAINMAANLSDGAGMARANAMQQGQSQPNMIGAPGGIDRTNTEDESEKYPSAGRESYEARKNGEN